MMRTNYKVIKAEKYCTIVSYANNLWVKTDKMNAASQNANLIIENDKYINLNELITDHSEGAFDIHYSQETHSIIFYCRRITSENILGITTVVVSKKSTELQASSYEGIDAPYDEPAPLIKVTISL